MNIELALPDVILVRALLADVLNEIGGDEHLTEVQWSLKERTERIYSIFDNALPQKKEVQEKVMEIEEDEEGFTVQVHTGRIESDKSNLSNTSKPFDRYEESVKADAVRFLESQIEELEECTYGYLGTCTCSLHFSSPKIEEDKE